MNTDIFFWIFSRRKIHSEKEDNLRFIRVNPCYPWFKSFHRLQFEYKVAGTFHVPQQQRQPRPPSASALPAKRNPSLLRQMESAYYYAPPLGLNRRISTPLAAIFLLKLFAGRSIMIDADRKSRFDKGYLLQALQVSSESFASRGTDSVEQYWK